MSFGRHHGRNFASKHANGEPVIQNYDDVVSFIAVKRGEFSLDDAIALRLFNVKLEYTISNLEKGRGKPFDDLEINQYIADHYDVGRLNEILKEAHARMLQYIVVSDANLSFWKSTRRGAWQGFAGNILFAAVGIALIVIANAVKDVYLAQSVVAYWNKCVAPIWR